jgi:23S rRNA pseudouridine1911/1915/1917 synthase
VGRAYLAVVPGQVAAQTMVSYLVRDRGDGLRGSSADPEQGQRAVTHVRPVETLAEYTLLECRLETGRTHQIRIHLAELGHPVCGDPIYRGPLGVAVIEDHSGAPRLALHATHLQLTHPASGESIACQSPLPSDLSRFLDRLRR